MACKRLVPVLACMVIMLSYGSLVSSARSGNAIPTPIVQETPVFSGLSGVWLVDTQHGWMLSNYSLSKGDYETTVDETPDGGQTWQTLAVVSPPAPYDGSLVESSDKLRFANTKDGWIYGADLYATHDGGKTWQKDPSYHNSTSFEVADGTIWMMCGTCDTSNKSNYSLAISKDDGGTCQSKSLPGANLDFPNYPIQLTTLDDQTAWIIVLGQIDFAMSTPASPDDTALHNLHLLSTDEGGSTWQVRPVPANCDGPAWGSGELAAIDPQHLWYACGISGATDLGGKYVSLSSDSGRSWQVKLSVDMFQMDGVVSNVGGLEHLYAITSQSIWMTLNRNSPQMTDNAGKTWQQTDYTLDVGDEGNDRRLTWVDPLHIWYFSTRWLFSSNDAGKTWIMLRH